MIVSKTRNAPGWATKADYLIPNGVKCNENVIWVSVLRLYKAKKNWSSVSQALFWKNECEGAKFFFYCVWLFFTCFPVDSNEKHCVISYTLPLITNIFENNKMKYSSNVL